jgi:hypothetical protein
MKHKAVKELFQYWNDLRGERTAPERNEMDPNAIRNILADTFQLEIDAQRTFPIRLAGTRINALYTAEQKGRSFLDLWRPEEAHNIATVLLTVADGACPVVAGAVASAKGGNEVALELLLLPVRHYGKTHARILGIVAPLKTPTWLGTLAIGQMNLRSLRVVDNEEMRPVRAPVQSNRYLPASQDRRSIMLHDRPRHPFLQVIEGGRGQNIQPPRDHAGFARLRRELTATYEEKSR